MASDEQVHMAAKWISGELKDGTPEELEARRTFAEILRSTLPLDMSLRVMLAARIDPDSRDSFEWLAFHRAPGRMTRHDLRRIAATVWHHHVVAGDSWESAVAQAEKEHRVSRATVTAAWHKWSPVFRGRDGQTFTRL
jgi:hypothetical protein